MKKDPRLLQQLFPFEFDPVYTLDDFFSSEENKTALSAATRVAEGDPEIEKSLYFFGEPGHGKTHLLHALGNHRSAREPDSVIKLIQGKLIRERLTEESCREEGIADLVRWHENADMFLIDDIDETAPYPALQQALFHLYNHLKERGNVFVATGAKAPSDITALSPHLSTRLGWGLAIQIGPPDDEARRKILYKLASERRLPLSEREIGYVLAHFPRDVAMLRRIVEVVNLYSLKTRRKVTIPLIKEACASLSDH